MVDAALQILGACWVLVSVTMALRTAVETYAVRNTVSTWKFVAAVIANFFVGLVVWPVWLWSEM